MPNVKVEADEWYPVFEVVDEKYNYGTPVFLTDEQLKIVTEASEAFNIAQSILHNAVNTARNA